MLRTPFFLRFTTCFRCRLPSNCRFAPLPFGWSVLFLLTLLGFLFWFLPFPYFSLLTNLMTFMILLPAHADTCYYYYPWAGFIKPLECSLGIRPKFWWSFVFGGLLWSGDSPQHLLRFGCGERENKAPQIHARVYGSTAGQGYIFISTRAPGTGKGSKLVNATLQCNLSVASRLPTPQRAILDVIVLSRFFLSRV